VTTHAPAGRAQRIDVGRHDHAQRLGAGRIAPAVGDQFLGVGRVQVAEAGRQVQRGDVAGQLDLAFAEGQRREKLLGGQLRCGRGGIGCHGRQCGGGQAQAEQGGEDAAHGYSLL